MIKLVEFRKKIEKIHNNLQKLVNKVKSGGQLAPNDISLIQDNIAEIHYTLSHAMPWARGSNGIIDSYVRSLYQSLGLNLPALKNNVSLDLEAFCTDLDTFKQNWKNGDFFATTYVDLDSVDVDVDVDNSVKPTTGNQTAKYELDERGFIKTSEYSKLSNDELIREYTKLKEYEADGENIVLDNNRNSDDCQVEINTHWRFTEKEAIKAELDKRGLKLKRMHVDGKTVYSYSKKPIATDAPSNTPTADVDVKYNEVGRKMTKGYDNKDIIDPSEYNNLTNYELYSEYKELYNDMHASTFGKYGSDQFSHNYTNNLNQIEAILYKRGYKIGDLGLVKINMSIWERIKFFFMDTT